MAQFLHGLLSASMRGSVVIVAVLFLRLVLRKTPKKFLCLMWLLVGLALLMPFEIRRDLSLQPEWETGQRCSGWRMFLYPQIRCHCRQ